ncbi:MAG: YcgN family cysteine cluster protein [Allosphingosinicella sp.]|jgi:uncharacterized cysteine cluster protein YcgN (CxxCxxCC family)
MNFWEKPIEALTRDEWESLCDGCGKCCLHKLEDADTGEVHPTNVACKLLDTHTARCTHYRGRRAFVPDCIRLTAANVERFGWLPATCAYRLRAEGKPLFDWHPLVSGDPESVHRAGMSVRGWTVPEGEVRDLELHLVDREL